MNLLTSTLSLISSVGIMLPEGIQNASTTKGRTKPKTSAKETARMITYSTRPPPFFLRDGRSCSPVRKCWSSKWGRSDMGTKHIARRGGRSEALACDRLAFAPSRYGRKLEDAQGLRQEPQRHDHHEDAESHPQLPLRQPVPQAHAERRADHGAHDERRQAQELVGVAEAGGDVPGGADQASKHHDREARRDGLLRAEPHPEHHQGDHHHPAPDADEPRERPDKHPGHKDQGERDLLAALEVAPAFGRGVGERDQEHGKGDLDDRLGRDPAYGDPDQGRRRDGEREDAGSPPVHGVIALGVPDGPRERAEDDDDQARGHGLLYLPSPGVNEPRDEDDAAPDPHEPGEYPAGDPDNAEDRVAQVVHLAHELLQPVHRAILAEPMLRFSDPFRLWRCARSASARGGRRRRQRTPRRRRSRGSGESLRSSPSSPRARTRGKLA